MMAWWRPVRAVLLLTCLVVSPAAQVGAQGGAQLAPDGAAPSGQPAPRPQAAIKFDLERTLDAARQTVRLFSERLKGELSVAIKTDGAANAISLCQTISPDISTALTDDSGFEVSRTSLKLRNPENAPGPWELEVLRMFQDKVASGADPSKLEHHAEMTTPEGDRLFRYMKAIPTGDMCLSCHGTDVKADVRAELTRYYPADKATGYRLGELRGAFSLVKLIEE